MSEGLQERERDRRRGSIQEEDMYISVMIVRYYNLILNVCLFTFMSLLLSISQERQASAEYVAEHTFTAPHEVTYGFCEEFMPGVSRQCCSALSGVRR